MDTRRLLVQSLKGSQAQVLIAFLFASAAMDVRELQGWTGLKKETIRQALGALRDKGLVDRQVLAHGRRVWLPAGDLLMVQNTEKRTPALQNTEKRTSDLASSSGTNVPLLLEEEQEEESQESTKRTSVLVACDQVGIREPARSRLAELEHVTPRLVKAHSDYAKAQDKSLGTAIYRIEHDWPISSDWGKSKDELDRESIERMGVCPNCFSRPCHCDDVEV